jgi:hypothetical protein
MRLSELWQEVYREVMQFTETLARLPDECRCGDAEAHLEERCPCCESSHARGPLGAGGSCAETVSRLQADFSMLWEDVKRVSAPIEEAAPREDLLEIRRGVFLAAKDLEQIGRELERVTEAVLGFRRSCAVSELRRAKRHAAELRAHCERVNNNLTRRAGE